MSAVASTNASQRCFLLQLPTELQLMVYRHVLHTRGDIRLDIGGDIVLYGVYPNAAIMRTCRSIHAICDDVLYKENRFIVVMHAECCDVVSQLAHLLRQARHLNIAMRKLIGSPAQETVARLAKELAQNSGLKHLELYFCDTGVSTERCDCLAKLFEDVRVQGEVSVSTYTSSCTVDLPFSDGIGMSETARGALVKAMQDGLPEHLTVGKA